MVTILGVNLNKNQLFVSIRWKLVSTYLLLAILFLIVINIFITETLRSNYLEQKKVEMLANANILANSVKNYVFTLDHPTSKLQLQYEIENYSSEVNSRILVVDEDYRVRGDSNDLFTGKILKHIEIQEALKGKSSVNTYNFKGTGHVMYIAVPIILENDIIGTTFISTSLRDVYNRISEIQYMLNMVSLISIFIMTIIGYVLAAFFSRPIEKFTKVTARLSEGKLGEKIEIKTNDEFNELAKAFNIMSTKLGQVDQQRKDFVANVSHELRTPLSSIKLLSGSLLHQEEKNVAIYREFLEDIDSEIDRLNNIIDDLLVLVDIDKEKLTLNYKPTYVNFLLEKIITRLKPLAEQKNIQLQYQQIDKIQIRLDPKKIQQSIINIVHNAIKYTPEGGQVNVSIYKEGTNLTIKVEDNGIGISEEGLPHVFERFYRVDKARTRNTGGTGLGLSIAKQIVELHQGTIGVKSKVGVGTAFYIKLPLNMKGL